MGCCTEEDSLLEVPSPLGHRTSHHGTISRIPGLYYHCQKIREMDRSLVENVTAVT